MIDTLTRVHDSLDGAADGLASAVISIVLVRPFFSHCIY
jgi:hypothetical protein